MITGEGMCAIFDAHCHLQDSSLAPVRESLLGSETHGIQTWLVNGTHPGDWAAVAELAERDERVIPAFGWHPWYVDSQVSEQHIEQLKILLQTYPNAHVGEIGVDRWKVGLDEDLQLKALTTQLEIAAEFRRPVTIHCLKAWGLLERAWEAAKQRPKKVLLHAFNGSIETANQWSRRGAYFSYSTYFLHTRKTAQRAVFGRLPEDRLLVETDAPAMKPPKELCIDKANEDVNHPLNLKQAYESLANVRAMSLESLSAIVSENFTRFTSVIDD